MGVQITDHNYPPATIPPRGPPLDNILHILLNITWYFRCIILTTSKYPPPPSSQRCNTLLGRQPPTYRIDYPNCCMSLFKGVTIQRECNISLNEVVYIRGSHTTSESAFILREWARDEARLVVWWRGRFILLHRRWRRILLSPRMKFNLLLAPDFHLFATLLLLLFDFFIYDLLLLPTLVPVQSANIVNTSQRFILHARNGPKGMSQPMLNRYSTICRVYNIGMSMVLSTIRPHYVDGAIPAPYLYCMVSVLNTCFWYPRQEVEVNTHPRLRSCWEARNPSIPLRLDAL